jgi:hypothetical protein
MLVVDARKRAKPRSQFAGRRRSEDGTSPLIGRKAEQEAEASLNEVGERKIRRVRKGERRRRKKRRKGSRARRNEVGQRNHSERKVGPKECGYADVQRTWADI